MERKLTLQKNYSLADVTLAWIGLHLNGKTLLTLLWINLGIKFRKSKDPQFQINWSYIASQLNVSKSKVVREVNHLIQKGVLIKIESGVYVWNKEGIESLLNPKEAKPEPATVQEPVQERVIIMPTTARTNNLGLQVDEQGNIVF